MTTDYHFIRRPRVWDRSCHKWPCPETDHVDRVLNGKAKPRDKRVIGSRTASPEHEH